ncbi:MAG: hypothetical protein M1586_02135 [Patescibacteria group bacterium]|nr:hypothetical protein [Patescibacteria group bacterium]MCL5262080.1 hypothetical protein [Patescibacteria group bacterium]
MRISKKIDVVKIAAIAVLVVVAVISLVVILNVRSSAGPHQAENRTAAGAQHKRPILPSGRQVYRISQAAETWPKFIQATLDPVDVHVGDTQFLSVIVEDEAAIVSVEAKIETDNGELTLPLTYSEPAKVLLVPLGKIALAEESAKTSLYEGSWKVKDTHDITYHTTFVAKDVLGRESSITLAWSDACGIPFGGNVTLSSNCTISAVDGVDNGSLTITAGTTLTLNAEFVFNSGKTITINNGGAIAFGAGGVLRKTNLWMIDADSDNYPNSTNQIASDTAPANGRRRYLLNATGIDCNDANISIYPGVVTGSGSCSCSYSSTCDESASGTLDNTTCNSDGTYTGGVSSCTCTRDRDGYTCGTTYICGDYISHPPYTHRFSVPLTCAAGVCNATNWAAATDLGCSTSCTGCCSTSDCASTAWCNTVWECDACSNLASACGGGTPCNTCSGVSKPWYCDCSGYTSTSHCSGYQFVSSVQRCGTCGCSAGTTCQGDGTCL